MVRKNRLNRSRCSGHADARATTLARLALWPLLVGVALAAETGPPYPPPALWSIEPSPRSQMTNLTVVKVTFTEPVIGVVAGDLLVNGAPATSLAWTGAVCTFRFSQPAAGTVDIGWRAAHNITDQASNRFNETDYKATWLYTLLDVVPPTVAEINPLPGSTVGRLTEMAVTFSEAVQGVEAADLLINEEPALTVTGRGAGPYTFGFRGPPPGAVQLQWAAGHGIRDASPAANPFGGGSWICWLRPGEFVGNVVINEFLASNSSTNGLRDEDGDLDDWVEIHNRGTTAVNLNGWSLTDDPDVPDQWTFPAVTLGAGRYLVVFASGKDRKPANGANLHTNFRLGAAGQYLGLFNSDLPRQVATEFQPAYPEQRRDISYALFGDTFRYCTNPTPGRANSGAATFNGFAAPAKASVKSGFFNRPFAVTLASSTPGASIRYTLDGGEPTSTSGLLYTSPIPVTGTANRAVVNIRAVAFKSDLLSSRVVTYSYIFPDYVLSQPAAPSGFPSSWETIDDGAFSADYEMDRQVITNTASATLARQAITNIPSLLVVMDPADLFSRTRGIYANPNPPVVERDLWERAASIELLGPDGGAEFALDAGIKIHGCTSRDPNRTRKHSFSLIFDGDYSGKLEAPVFPGFPSGIFNRLVLDASSNYTWHNRADPQGRRAQYARDQFCSDLQLAMSHPSSHGRYVHLYLNGLYWGLYIIRERPDEDFAAAYFGGDDSQYDVVRNACDGFEVLAGNGDAWNSLVALVNAGLFNLSQYDQLRRYLDVDSFIDYMIVNCYAGNTDWAMHNWYACRKRTPGAGFQFVSWDAEFTLLNVTTNVSYKNDGPNTPTGMHSFLWYNAEYRLRFADRVHKHFSEGGVLFVDTNNPAVDLTHPELNRPAALYMKRIAEIDPAIVLESARWGDAVPGRENSPFTRNVEFLNELNWLTNTYFPQRSGIVLDQFRSRALYPGPLLGVLPPGFSQRGGNVASGFRLALSAPAGTIFYTTNGSDPRVYGSGDIAPDAVVYAAPVVINGTMIVKARVFDGMPLPQWSPLVEATFLVAQLLPPLRVTEIMYNPIGGDAYEFIELQNVGSTPLDVTGYSLRTKRASFAFPAGLVLAPGSVAVVASSLSFANRYPGVPVVGFFAGRLDNGSDRVEILDPAGRTVLSVDYYDRNGWPTAADGRGASLEIINRDGDPDAPANWRASLVLHGTPGVIAPATAPGLVLLNEIVAAGAAAGTVGGALPDWVELFNSGATPMDLGGWSLTDDGNPRKFVFPTGTLIGAGAYLVVYCDTQTNGPALHAGFALSADLSADGETISLYDPQTNRADALTYGPQIPDRSLGRFAGAWQLTLPTPNALNQLAPLGRPSNLFINEWLASSLPGQSDWIELYNGSDLPVALRGLYLATSNDLFQITSLSFIGPRGFLLLSADEKAGADHLDFKLHASGDAIILYDDCGQEINRVTFGPQLDGVSQGRLPDGAAAVVSFPGSPSPGTTNFLINYAGPRLNELMARNIRAVVEPFGQTADWIELVNPGAVPFDLSGMSLSVGEFEPGQWIFPAGVVLGAGGYLVLWCDKTREATTTLQDYLNLGRGLDADSGAVHLFNTAGQVVDSVEYGSQITDMSVGLVGGAWHLLSRPTPGAPNASPAPLGSPVNLRFNEWMAEALGGDDWFELYNLDRLPVDMGGIYLSDDPSISGQTKFRVAPLSFVAGHGWVKWIADGETDKGRHHVNFRLDSAGETLRLYRADLILIDSVDMDVQWAGISSGRLPDGGPNIVAFVTTPTPGEGNYVPLVSVAINEVLAHSASPLENAIELVNLTDHPINLGRWYLSDSQSEPKKFQIPAGHVLPPYGFRVFYEYQFNPWSGIFPSFSLDLAHGGELYLSEADSQSNLTGCRTSVQYPAAEPGISSGRFPTSDGFDFGALRRRTFGVDNPSTLGDFRQGTGLSNATPKIGPLVLNELMYYPVTTLDSIAIENPAEEFIEIYNVSGDPVPLFDPGAPTNTWRLRGGVEYVFPPGIQLPSRGYLLVVNFDPQTDAAALDNFIARYGLPFNTILLGPFQGRLGDDGEAIELAKPITPRGPGPDQGFVPYVLVDRVEYSTSAPWPTAAAGGGASLQRRSSLDYGNDPINWKAEPPTAGRANEQNGAVPPILTAQPQSVQAEPGSTVTFCISVSGTAPLSYQWQRDGLDLPSATNACLILPSVQQPADSGTYRVRVANAVGAITSLPATLRIFDAPVITFQPQSQRASLGADATFVVLVSGTEPLFFQWRFNDGPLPGATSATLTLRAVTAAQAGAYSVVASNLAGAVTSQVALLTVTGPDSDSDGTPDSWMVANFGHANGMAGDLSRPGDDADEDGLTNLEEYVAGTNPRDSRSALRLQVALSAHGAGNAQIVFTAVAGTSYTVQYRDGLAAGSWRKLFDVPAEPTTRQVPVGSLGSPGALPRFYRVVTPSQP